MPADARNRQIVLAEIPTGTLKADHFRPVDGKRPDPAQGELLVRTILLSVDPANRAWMRGRTYRDQLEAGQVMSAYGLAEVVEGGDSGIAPGSVVLCDCGWQEYAAVPATEATVVEVQGPLSHYVSALGITGLTAYFGLLEVGRPQEGETLLVSAAAGATGNVVGQIGKVRGLRVVGVTGSDDKNRMLEQELGFDATVNHRSESLSSDLRAACPDGIDVYFDNVAGPVLEAALGQMNMHGRIVCCGAVSGYDLDEDPPGPAGVPGALITRRLRMEGFIVMDFSDRWGEAAAEMAGWIREGRIKVLEDVTEGLENAPKALIGLLSGDNVGKRMVRVAPDPES